MHSLFGPRTSSVSTALVLCTFLFAFSFSSTDLLAADSRQAVQLEIEMDDSWELEDRSKVTGILYETANYIRSHLKDGPTIRIVVGYDREKGPIAMYRRRGQEFDTVLLSNSPLDYRPQIMYQFSHEFCHVISDYNRIRSTESKNEWLHETLCELASIFVLHATEEPALKRYIDDYLEESIQRLATITEFGEWLENNEDRLRELPRGELDRKTNAVVAYRLHPLFSDHPKIWNTLRYLPKSDSTLSDYLEEWKQSVESQDRYLIDLLRDKLLGNGDDKVP